MRVGVVAAGQYQEQRPRELRLTLAKNCAYSLHCRTYTAKYRIAVINQQEPDASDAVTLMKARPPWRDDNEPRLATIPERSRKVLGALVQWLRQIVRTKYECFAGPVRACSRGETTPVP